MKREFLARIGAGEPLRQAVVGQRVVFVPPYNTVLQAMGVHGVITQTARREFRVKFDKPVRWVLHGGYYREGSYENEFVYHFRQEVHPGMPL